MMSNNKILTVSYGTFSCTLEGFDDSFGTMKAIAEYFRGLSSDAPYFGAEPPQPDAEMLARIAQKEISRRVEAREHEGKIHLSAIENRVEDTPVAARTVMDEPVAKENVTPVAAPAALPDVPAEEVRVAPEVTVADDTGLQNFIKDEEEDIVPGQPDADVKAFFESAPTAVPDIEEDEIETAQDVKPAPEPVRNDSIAAKLQRIRAVVAQHQDDQDDDDFVEDQHADATDASRNAAEDMPEDMITTARREIEDALDADGAADDAADEAADAAADAAAQDDDADNEEDDIAAILSRLDAADAVKAADADEDILAISQVSDEQSSDDTDDALDNLFGEDGTDEDDYEDEDEDEDTDAAPVAASLVAIPEEKPVETPAAPRARVIKVKRADLEAAIEKGELEEYDTDDEEEAAIPSLNEIAPARTAGTSLSAEDEAELARELAELEADMSPKKAAQSDDLDADDADMSDDVDYDDEDDIAPAAAKPASAPVSRRILPSIDDTKGDDMDRLMAETDQQMGEPESATRRDAFSQLRAAVAAKKADVALGASEPIADDDGAYRNDLADVVRPRRPASGSARTERPGEGRPAPLKLVAEQRIDVASPRPAGPVRPRRVAAVAEVASAQDGDSFADYAAEMGATKLPQLLEAAAAYMSFVEGREQFSRPQLMTKVRQVGPEDGFSREDGLRSFGQLLRTGKIEKIKGGRFTVSDDIGFRPDRRAAG